MVDILYREIVAHLEVLSSNDEAEDKRVCLDSANEYFMRNIKIEALFLPCRGELFGRY